jgi:hypothetical protein
MEPYSLLRRTKSMKWKSILDAGSDNTFSIRCPTGEEFTATTMLSASVRRITAKQHAAREIGTTTRT